MEYHFFKRSRDPRIVQHVLHWLRNPDQNSEFEKKARALKRLPDRVATTLLLLRGYDGMLATQDDKVVGHVFYQRRGNEYHVFSVWVDEILRGKGIARTILTEFVRHCVNKTWIAQIRIGSDNNPAIKQLRESTLTKGALDMFPVTIINRGDGWLEIQRNVFKILSQEEHNTREMLLHIDADPEVPNLFPNAGKMMQ